MDYLSEYLTYAGAGENEVPILFHRWVSISILGALIGRKTYIMFGHNKLYFNQYIMLMGSPGSRKSTAINIGASLLRETGYRKFAPDKVSKERFLISMQKSGIDGMDMDDLLDMVFNEPAEIFITAEEFGDFIGQGDNGFALMLTKLWDNPAQYEHPKINGTDVFVNEPTVNMIAGNTPKTFQESFPPEAVGNGFLSRLIFVHGETTDRKVAFPSPADKELKAKLAAHLKDIKSFEGEVVMEKDARALLETIYYETKPMQDERFAGYSSRRFVHLLKLTSLFALANHRLAISVDDVLKANGLLYVTEVRMPSALGEYGKSKYSDVMNTVIAVLQKAKNPVTAETLWKVVHKDLTKITELHDILRGLAAADRIKHTEVKKANGTMARGWVLIPQSMVQWKPEHMNIEWLMLEEMV